MKLTNSILSELLGIPLSKIRRWTKEFLTPHPRATRRSGYTREITPNESFYIFLGGHLVTNFGWTYHQARTALEIIWQWMEKNGMVPEIPEWAKREGIDCEISRYESMEIFLDPSSNAVTVITVQGVSTSESEVTDKKTDSLGRPYLRIKTERILYYPISKIKTFEGERWIAHEPDEIFGVLNLEDLLRRHLFSIFDRSQYKNWQKRFREIAKPD
jgi:hypothetical protein